MTEQFPAEHWLLDSLPDSVVLIDEAWQVVFINHAAESLLGVARGAVLTAEGARRLALAREWEEALRDAMCRRCSRPLSDVQRDVGGEVRVLAGEAHPSPTGGVALVFRDVSDRKRGEEELRLRDRAISASLNGIILTDARQPDNPIVFANPAFYRLSGYEPDEVLGRNCRFLQRDDRAQPAVDQLRRAVAEGRSCSVVLRNYRKSGEMFWNELSIAPLRDERGGLTHFVGVQQDITERKRAQDDLVERNSQLQVARDELAQRHQELREATHAKDRFMATVSHEMRTPLNAILGYVEVLTLGIAGELDEVQQRHLQRIGASGRALLDLINDVLDFTRAAAGRLRIELVPLRLEAVVEEAVELVRLAAEEKGLRLRVEPWAEALPPVLGDFRRLRQILVNLLSNAVKFTHRGEITVHPERLAGGAVAVGVRDTGIGISREQQAQIFKEFYQADSDLTREYGGTGLGLAISQRLAEMMGGEITVHSEVGEGSSFRLALPPADPGALQRAGPPGRVQTDGEVMEAPPVVVVIFGRDAEGMEALRRQLEPRVRVLSTDSPESVAELARREQAALVVLDVACDGGVGWEAAHEVREDARLDETAVLLLPCLPRPEDGGSPGALDLGWVAVVPKPFTPAQLTQMVNRAAGRDNGGPGDALDVLVVDDDSDAREIAAKILGSAGATVRAAGDGEAGLLEMRRTRPDVAVLDLMMPVLDGFGVLAAMRADPALRDVPVVVLTAKDLSDAERSFLARTAETVLQKGVHSLSDVTTLVLRAASR